jgi:hypothetical protein
MDQDPPVAAAAPAAYLVTHMTIVQSLDEALAFANEWGQRPPSTLGYASSWDSLSPQALTAALEMIVARMRERSN